HLHYSFLCNQTPATNLYTLSLHDALPISRRMSKTGWALASFAGIAAWFAATVYAAASNPDPSDATPVLRTFAGGGAVFCAAVLIDRKSTRLNSSHVKISYAVFCLKKKKDK